MPKQRADRFTADLLEAQNEVMTSLEATGEALDHGNLGAARKSFIRTVKALTYFFDLENKQGEKI